MVYIDYFFDKKYSLYCFIYRLVKLFINNSDSNNPISKVLFVIFVYFK